LPNGKWFGLNEIKIEKSCEQQMAALHWPQEGMKIGRHPMVLSMDHSMV
jgi:hypothetical protein